MAGTSGDIPIGWPHLWTLPSPTKGFREEDGRDGALCVELNFRALGLQRSPLSIDDVEVARKSLLITLGAKRRGVARGHQCAVHGFALRGERAQVGERVFDFAE